MRSFELTLGLKPCRRDGSKPMRLALGGGRKLNVLSRDS